MNIHHTKVQRSTTIILENAIVWLRDEYVWLSHWDLHRLVVQRHWWLDGTGRVAQVEGSAHCNCSQSEQSRGL